MYIYIAPYFVENILDILGDIKGVPFSLILDEGTDISVDKLLGVVIRYIGLERILNIFDFKHLVAIGTDNPAVMSETHNGLCRKIKEKFNLPNMILVTCVCHSIQLAIVNISLFFMCTYVFIYVLCIFMFYVIC